MSAVATGRVVIVDNAHRLCALLIGVARRHELDNLSVVGSPEEARTVLRGDAVVKMFCDWRMPGADGVEFLREVRGRYPEVECTLLTGWAGELGPRELSELRENRITVVEKDCIDEQWLVDVCNEVPTRAQQRDPMPLEGEDLAERPSALEELATARLELALEAAQSERRRAALAVMAKPLVRQLQTLGPRGDAGLFGHSERLTIEDLVRHISEQTDFGVRLLEIDRAMQEER